MGVENFVPQMWSAKLFVRLRKAMVHASLVNRDYEGEIKNQGDTVKINEIGPIDISDRTKYGTLTWQELDSYQKTLLIDQAKTFSFTVDDIDIMQSNVNLVDAAMGEAAYALADTVDADLAGLYGDAGNSVSAVTVTAGNILVNLSNMAYELDNAKVPQAGRFMPIAPWYHQYLVQAATGIVSATATPKVFDNGMLANNFVGTLFGINLLMSHNVNNNSTVWNNMAFTRDAITFASQINQVKAVDIEDGFEQGVKGLLLYGRKVIRPEAMVSCAATKG